jgi:hypothetical protein
MGTIQIIPTAPYTSHHHMQPQIRLDRERDGDGPCSTVRAGGGALAIESMCRLRIEGSSDGEGARTERGTRGGPLVTVLRVDEDGS